MFTQRNSSIFFIHWLGINLFLASFVLSSCSVLLSAQTVEKCNEQQALNWFETENAQHSRGELEQALENWEKAVTCYKELNSNQFIIALLINLASVYTERRNYTVSLDYLNQALDNL
ncbi:MAG: tetratricopeptide repeat protein, partial [Flavobacteriales bacterium]|nr:tetratricopeptide repeat protein [Flavobacteriales bacterium]